MIRFPGKRLALVLLFVSLASLPLFAQDAGATGTPQFKNESEFYYVNIPIEKVYRHTLGYVVLYRAGTKLKKAYMPDSWFEKAAGKAQLVTIKTGNVWPYLVVYYKNGSYSHAILYIRENLMHPSWGSIPGNPDLSEEFAVEELSVP